MSVQIINFTQQPKANLITNEYYLNTLFIYSMLSKITCFTAGKLHIIKQIRLSETQMVNFEQSKLIF